MLRAEDPRRADEAVEGQARHPAQETHPDSAARPDFIKAGDAYAKASDLNPKEHSLAYNAGLDVITITRCDR